jgi:hypothetical protein
MTNLIKDELISSSVMSDFIKQGSPIIDKTKIICKLLKKPMGAYLICRPRRFGKTLLLDTIDNIFKGKRDLFQNLAINDDNSGYNWNIFPVIRLDMSGMSSTPDILSQELVAKIGKIAKRHDVPISGSRETVAISNLITDISDKHVDFAKNNNIDIDEDDPKNVVLLIDEYDYPLQNNILDFTKSKETRALLRDFFAGIKSNQNYLRFVLIAGITKFDQLFLSSGMNNVEDLSYYTDFSEICGFTRAEITTTFSRYFQTALDVMKRRGRIDSSTSVDMLLDLMEDWYNGYSWDGDRGEHKVLNPYSVIQFLNKHILSSYWQNTGSPMVFEQLGIGPENYFRIFQENLSLTNNITIIESRNVFNDDAIMFQAGYLTIDSVDKINGSIVYELRIPNFEVRQKLRESFLLRRTNRDTIVSPLPLANPKYKNFYNAFCNRDEAVCEMLFSSFITSASYEYNLSGERLFTVLLSLCLDIGSDKPNLETHTSKGRSDIVMRTPSGEWMIIEIKNDDPSTHSCQSVQVTQYVVSSPLTISGGVSKQHKLELSDDYIIDPLSIKTSLAPDTVFNHFKCHDPTVLTVSDIPDIAEKSLEANIVTAFQQMVKKDYALPYFGGETIVWAVAIAIYNSRFVRIRFRQAVWTDKTQRKIIIPSH